MARAEKPRLPPAPPFPDADVPSRYPDGSYSISGLRSKLEANVRRGQEGEEIEVRAYVQWIYVPPTCPAGESCPPAKQPHVRVTDRPDDKGHRRAMLVVNYKFAIPEWDAKLWRGAPEVELEVGKAYTFRGKFKRFSDTGFAHDRGLLEFVAYKRPGKRGKRQWIHPPGAPWHPIELKRQEQENEALRTRSRTSGTSRR